MTNNSKHGGERKRALEALEAVSKAIFDSRSTRNPAEIYDDIEEIKAALTQPPAVDVDEVNAVMNAIKLAAYSSAGEFNTLSSQLAVWAGRLERALITGKDA